MGGGARNRYPQSLSPMHQRRQKARDLACSLYSALAWYASRSSSYPMKLSETTPGTGAAATSTARQRWTTPRKSRSAPLPGHWRTCGHTRGGGQRARWGVSVRATGVTPVHYMSVPRPPSSHRKHVEPDEAVHAPPRARRRDEVAPAPGPAVRREHRGGPRKGPHRGVVGEAAAPVALGGGLGEELHHLRCFFVGALREKNGGKTSWKCKAPTLQHFSWRASTSPPRSSSPTSGGPRSAPRESRRGRPGRGAPRRGLP